MAKKEDLFAEINVKENLKKFWHFVSKYKGLTLGLIILIIGTETASFFDNFIFKYLIDQGTLFSQNEITAVVFSKLILLAVLIFLGVKLLDALFWYLKIRYVNKLESNVLADVEQASFWHITNLSYRFHSDKKTGSLISQFTRGVNKVESLMDVFIFNFVPVIVRLILSVTVLAYFDTTTAIILASMAIVYTIIGVYITHKQKIPQAIANYAEDDLKQNLSDVFLNIETVKYFGKEKRTFSYFRNLSQHLAQSRRNFWKYFSWHAGIQTSVIGIGVTAVFYVTFTQFLEGNITLGTIALIYAAVWKILPMLFGMIHGYREYIRSLVDVDALFKTLKEKKEVLDKPNAKPLKVKDGAINFDKISFAYPSKKNEKQPVIKGFNLPIKKNTKIALVGHSGSGKTTIIKLLYRLYDLHEGTITIDNQDISQVTQKSLRNSLSIVPQEPLLFDNTIYFNIAYANPKAKPKEVWKAIRFAQLDKFINKLPQKEKTLVGERGVKLSGGEKQRVSIARALLANKKILILDEATSSLDSHTEREIQRDLDKLMKNRTSIIIAHRLSTVMKADLIVVMDKGKIIEIGTHKQLKRKPNGAYQKLWKIQQGLI